MSEYSSSDEEPQWIPQFCASYGREFFCEVPPEFIEDDFNLTGLGAMVPHYREALDVILDIEDSDGGDPLVGQSAEVLYGLIHARYIITKGGLHLMADKFERGVFGQCPRHLCGGFHLIPLGRSDIIGIETVRLYCASCNDLYLPPSSRYLNLDGAFFGSSFAGLFVQMFPEVNKLSQRKPPFQLKLFGLALNDRAVAGPRMKWLRSHPESNDDLLQWEFPHANNNNNNNTNSNGNISGGDAMSIN